MYTVKEAAQRIGVSERHLRLLLESGKVKGRKMGRDWLVSSKSYKRKRGPKKPTLPLDTHLGKGDAGPTTREGSLILDLLEDGAATVGQLVEALTNYGVSRKYAVSVVRSAIRAGVLAVH